MKKAEQLICPAPMPEDPVDARLAGLLVPAPHVVPEPAAPLIGRPLGLLAREPDNQPAQTSSANPVKGKGV